MINLSQVLLLYDLYWKALMPCDVCHKVQGNVWHFKEDGTASFVVVPLLFWVLDWGSSHMFINHIDSPLVVVLAWKPDIPHVLPANPVWNCGYVGTAF